MSTSQVKIPLEDPSMASIEEAIDKKIGEVRTEALDMSFGELLNLHSNKELVIDPEFQRLIRWSPEQRSRLVESILLELPVPQIFVIERSDGTFELIDGLQRIASVIHFVDPANLPNPDSDGSTPTPLVLVGCDLIPELNGKTFEEIPLRLRLRIKRTPVRVVVIKRQSAPLLRYEMFKRLNTGGALLSPQEIRNCVVRMVGEAGSGFYTFLQRLAALPSFATCTEPISQSDRAQRMDEELVLRFLALKNGEDLFRGSVRDWLDNYMESVVLSKRAFNQAAEEASFAAVFDYLASVMGVEAFVRHKDNTPIGGLAPAYFEAVSMGTHKALSRLALVEPTRVREAIVSVTQKDEFRRNTGPGANSREKLATRVALVEQALNSLPDGTA